MSYVASCLVIDFLGKSEFETCQNTRNGDFYHILKDKTDNIIICL